MKDMLPREKLQSFGAKNLRDKELLAILLGSGSAKIDVFSLAKKVLVELDKQNENLCFKELIKIKKAEDIIPLIQHLANREQETFICITLSGAHEVIASRVITIGLVNLCQIHPREVFAQAITDRASAIIVAHNHPSGDLTPSKADLEITQRLKESAAILGVKFLDHIIFSKRGFCSIESYQKKLKKEIMKTSDLNN